MQIPCCLRNAEKIIRVWRSMTDMACYASPMNTRKELPKAARLRICLIDRQIASGACPNTRKLAEACGTSEAAISRDIGFMRNMRKVLSNLTKPLRI
jgi:hypothetical protein